MVAFPVAELCAHFSGYIIKIFEFPFPAGRGVRRLGLLALFILPLSFWLTLSVSIYWAFPFLVCLTVIALCGHTLTVMEERQLARIYSKKRF